MSSAHPLANSLEGGTYCALLGATYGIPGGCPRGLLPFGPFLQLEFKWFCQLGLYTSDTGLPVMIMRFVHVQGINLIV